MRPYLRVANVFEDRIDTLDVMRMNFTPREFEIYRLEEGDILLNEGQSLELVGRPAMYRNEVPDCCFQNTLVRFRADHSVNRDYALIVFRAYFRMGQFQRIAKITTNLAHLGAHRFARLEFPLPPPGEQLEIVHEVDRRLSAADRLARKLDQQLARALNMRQSLLQDAFSGRLVPQNPEDEAASVLLGRIRVDREAEARRPRGKRMSRAKPEIRARGRRSLLAVLRENGGPMTPEALFRASGHSQESVDQFFAELRELTAAPPKVVEETGAGGLRLLRALS
jgi:type I restriction enzyme S subunit